MFLVSPRTLLLWALFAAAAAGCRGRAEFYRGEELLRAGDRRGAFLHFHEAWRLRPNATHARALEGLGQAIAAGHVEEGLGAERRLDFTAALAAHALALEYDPRSAAARDGYRRAFGEVERWRAMEEALEAARRRPAGAGAWERLDLHIRAAALPACPAGHRRPLVEEALAALRDEVAALEASGLPAGAAPGPLEELRRRWERLEAAAWRAVSREEEAAEAGVPASGGGLEREVAALGLLRKELPALARRASGGAEEADRALAGIAALGEGLRREADGELAGALAACERALRLHPRLPEARLAWERLRERRRRECHAAARVAMARHEWAEAIEHLDRLLELGGEEADARQRRELCRLELARAARRAAEELEARGLPGNALVRWLEARALRPADAAAARGVERCEALLRARLEPPFVLEFRPPEAADGALRLELWGVGEETLREVEGLIAAGFGARPQEGPAVKVQIKDLDFACYEQSSSLSLVPYRGLRSFEVAPCPDRARAREELERARRRAAAARLALEGAPPHRRPGLEDLLGLALGEVEQALWKLEAMPAWVPVLEWEERSIPLKTASLAAELALRYRLERLAPEGRWVASRWREIVEGGGSVRRPGSPPPNRAELLRDLARRLGEELRRDLESLRAGARAGHYRLALERLEAGSRHQAIEHLVSFIFLHRGEAAPPPEHAEAARQLVQLARSRDILDWAGGR
jgi:tetratricopeptide (TPR) repeat protein